MADRRDSIDIVCISSRNTSQRGTSIPMKRERGFKLYTCGAQSLFTIFSFVNHDRAQIATPNNYALRILLTQTASRTMRLNFFLVVVVLVICYNNFAAAERSVQMTVNIEGEERTLSWLETLKNYITTNEEKLKKMVKASKNIFP
ncbi:hypothetical protein P3T76_003341 [Phytophthora citrophthora]|uniref:Uncharacterized protein n=1 Tax=Phytophthora citrophthora TaxID=4793 RepID=A0AAD9GVE0_9STRA|nr:hypothetical protein P3T76_003341 [Phytophthora citrophthora]